MAIQTCMSLVHCRKAVNFFVTQKKGSSCQASKKDWYRQWLKAGKGKAMSACLRNTIIYLRFHIILPSIYIQCKFYIYIYIYIYINEFKTVVLELLMCLLLNHH